MRVLAGDVGGTKTLLMIADIYPNQFKQVYVQRFVSARYPDFITMLREFLPAAAAKADLIISSVCIGVAGPVRDNHATITNLPWDISGDQVARELGVKSARLINDFQAVGYGLETLDDQELETLQGGQLERRGPRVVIGAGTGLGEGVLYWQGDHYNILPSEGGHTDFAPANGRQLAFMQYMMQKLDRVSYEHVLSGRGIFNIYSWLRDSGSGTEDPQLAEELRGSIVDPAAAISIAAQERGDPLALAAMEMFCEVYGAQTGNLALTCVARGGVYVAGGIAPKIISLLRRGSFMQAFGNKGKMESLMETLPVQVVMNPEVGLRGAAIYASRANRQLAGSSGLKSAV